jgi:hypothetical protein
MAANNNYGRETASFLNWATIWNNNYGREAAAFLKEKYTIGNNNYWATIGNNNYGREAATFLKANYWVSFGQWGQQLGPRSGRLLELGNNCEQQLRARSGRLFEGKIMGLFWTIGTTTRAAERPPSRIEQQLGTTTTGAKRPPSF